MKAAVGKESAETQEYESCQQNDMEVDRDEGMEESSLVPSAIVDATGWHKARFMCNNRCKREGFDLFDMAAILAEDEGRPHTINHCKKWYNLSLAERHEPAVTHARWKAMIGEESSRRGAKGFAGSMLGTVRSLQVAGKSLDGRGSNSGAAGEKLAGGVDVQKGFCAASRKYDTRWADLLKSARLNAWTKAMMQECHYEVRLEDRKSTAQHVIAVPESVRRGPTPKSSPFKAAPIQSTASTRRDDFATPTDMARPTKRNHQLRRRRCNPPGTACERVVLDRIKTFFECKYQGGSQWVGAFLVQTRRYRYQHHVFRRKREGWRQQQVRAARHTSRKGARRAGHVADVARFAEAAREVRRRRSFDKAQILPEFDAVYARSTKGQRSSSNRLTTFLAKERPDVVEMEELEKYGLGPIDTEGIIGVVAWSACAHEERRRCVAIEKKEDAAGKWWSSLRRLRATRDRECRELQEAIECTNGRPQKACVRDGTQKEVVEEMSHNFGIICQENYGLGRQDLGG